MDIKDINKGPSGEENLTKLSKDPTSFNSDLKSYDLKELLNSLWSIPPEDPSFVDLYIRARVEYKRLKHTAEHLSTEDSPTRIFYGIKIGKDCDCKTTADAFVQKLYSFMNKLNNSTDDSTKEEIEEELQLFKEKWQNSIGVLNHEKETLLSEALSLAKAKTKITLKFEPFISIARNYNMTADFIEGMVEKQNEQQGKRLMELLRKNYASITPEEEMELVKYFSETPPILKDAERAWVQHLAVKKDNEHGKNAASVVLDFIKDRDLPKRNVWGREMVANPSLPFEFVENEFVSRLLISLKIIHENEGRPVAKDAKIKLDEFCEHWHEDPNLTEEEKETLLGKSLVLAKKLAASEDETEKKFAQDYNMVVDVIEGMMEKQQSDQPQDGPQDGM